MGENFQLFFERLRNSTPVTTQMALAEALGVNRSAVTQAKNRDSVPQKWILALARRFQISPDWLEFGTGSPADVLLRPTGTPAEEDSGPAGRGKRRKSASVRKNAVPPPVGPSAGQRLSIGRRLPGAGGELVHVPKVSARLCAGGGSFEVQANPLSTHPFPRQWLARLGMPGAMVFMDVVGDSMEPGIQDGDTVMVDQSVSQPVPGAVLAVGVEEAIYLKRVERRDGGLTLLSDNPAHAPMTLSGDELGNFRIIGKVVWLCREF